MALKNTGLYKLILSFFDWASRLVNRQRVAWQGEEVVGKPEKITLVPTLPLNWTQLPAAVQGYFQESLTWSEPRVYRLRRVYVSWHAVVLRNFRVFLPALAAPHWEHYYTNSYLLKQWLGKKVSVANPTVPIALVHDQWTRNNYYHWLVDALPRLLVLREHCPSARLVMPAPVTIFMAQTAQLLGFHNFVSVAEDEVLSVETLVVPGRVAPLGYHHPALLRRLRQEITNALIPVTAKPPTRRIFASRSRQKLRQLTNEPEIMAVLQRHQFERIYFEELSFSQQVALMQQAEVLLGVHGANIVNLLFMQPGAKVIELFNQDKFLELANVNFENLIYYRLSSTLGLPYLAVPCQTTAGQVPSNDADVELSVATLEQALQWLR